jgi:outer membrane protein assembly factor BamB
VAEPREQWRYKFNHGATGGPVVRDGTVYSGGWNGYFYATDAHSGAPHWQRKLTPMGLRSTLLIVADRLYVAA